MSSLSKTNAIFFRRFFGTKPDYVVNYVAAMFVAVVVALICHENIILYSAYARPREKMSSLSKTNAILFGGFLALKLTML